MPTIHFMHGFVGYGKSTFARQLADKLGCKRISMDDIYAELNNGRAAINLSKDARAEILELTWQRLSDEVKAGRDVIFDSGAWTRKNRDYNRTRAEALGAKHKHYSIQCTPEIAWERVVQRNKERPGNEYPKSHFDEKFSYFQPMQEDEDCIKIGCS